MSGLGISPESCYGKALQSYEELTKAAAVLEDTFKADEPKSQSFTTDVEEAIQTYLSGVKEFNSLDVQARIVVEKIQSLIKSRLDDLNYMRLLPSKIQEALVQSKESADAKLPCRLSESFVFVPVPSSPIPISGNKKSSMNFEARPRNSLSDSFEFIGSSPSEKATFFDRFCTWACGSVRQS